MTETPDVRPAEGHDEEFRGKWPLPEGARPARGKEKPEPTGSSFPSSDPPSTIPSESASARR